MIVWLASYPRCGNTLLRQMLWSVWGLGTHSVYGDDIGTCDPRIPGMVGHRSFGAPFHEAYEKAVSSEELYFVKTHEIPIDAGKAILIVRDGRSAVRSFYHYRRDYERCTDESAILRDILFGFVRFGSWSNHLDNWDPLNRPNTLLVKYENLLTAPEAEISRMADFIGIAPRRSWKNGFEELSRIEPRLFRAAAANNPEEALSGADLELFWMLHGPWMRKLGYAPNAPVNGPPELPDQFRRSLYHAIIDQTLRMTLAQQAG